MKKKNKKKLPGYWLGTRKPTSLGYQPNYGIGNALFTSVEGEDLTPEANAARRNIIPSTLGKISQQGTNIAGILQNTVTRTAPSILGTASAATINAAAAGGIGARLLSPGAGADYMGSMFTSNGANLLGQKVGEETAKQASKTVLSTAGKVLGGLGAAYGAYSMFNDFANAGDIRSAGDMRNTASTNTYTTAGGNQYTQYGGIDAGAERRYERAQRDMRRVGLTLDAAGTGASIGSLIAPGIGTAIGAGAGVLFGGLSSLFGFGDNSDELEQQMIDTTNTLAMENKQRRSAAESDDVKQAFYGRAANGKQPVWSPEGLVNRKATARVSNGEVIGKFKKGRPGVIESQYRVPGPINNKTKFADTKKANVKADTYIVSNQKIPGTNIMLSDYAMATGDILGALNVLNMINLNKNNNKFKCGKKPGYALGTLGEYALATLPHMAGFFSNLGLYNRIKNASVHVPRTEVSMPETDAAINRIAQDKIDDRDYLNQSNKTYRLALWNIQRTPGIGFGARAIGALDLARMKFAQDAETKLKINQANWERDLAANEWAAKAGLAKSQMRNENFWRREDAWRQANGAKETALWQAVKNGDISLMNLGADALRMIQYNQSRDAQDRMLNIYQQQVNLDAERLKKMFPDDTKPTYTTKTAKEYKDLTDKYMSLNNTFSPTSLYPQYSIYKTPTLSYPYFKLNIR